MRKPQIGRIANITIGVDARMEAAEAVNRFKQMRREAEEVLSKLESFHEATTRMAEELCENLNAGIKEGAQYLAGLNGQPTDVEKNPALKTLIQLMQDDLGWFKREGARLSEIGRRYAAMNRLFPQLAQMPPSRPLKR